ncbi:hypothetical protein LBMAG25_09780 [Bacteroidota bacterium]|nr:hypothetical protein LBMAG25_09780 [Bacteroidota bacterium]
MIDFRQLFNAILLIGLAGSASAQKQYPVGTWVDHLPYSNPKVLAQTASRIYAACDNSLFYVNKSDDDMVRISKCTGLSDIGFNDIGYDETRNNLIICYSNSNVDIYNDASVYNIPDIKRKNISGDKNIYSVTIDTNVAYLACGFGIVVLDLVKLEIKDTYIIGPAGTSVKVNRVILNDGFIYAATNIGLLRASLNSPALGNFAVWELQAADVNLPAKACDHVESGNGTVYASFGDSIYTHTNNRWNLTYFRSGYSIARLRYQLDKLYACYINDEGGRIITIQDGAIDSIVNPAFNGYPSDVQVDSNNGITWIADFFKGLFKYKDNNAQRFTPSGPASSNIWQMQAYDGKVFLAPGGMDANYNFSYNRDGFFIYSDNQWNNYNGLTIPLLRDTVMDILAVAHQPQTDKTYFGSYVNGGIVEFSEQNISLYKQEALSSNIIFTNYACTGLTVDLSGNLWASNPTTNKPLVVRKPDGTWKKFPVSAISTSNNPTKLVADRFNQIWVSLIYQGMYVYNYGTDLDNTSDDQSKLLNGGFGQGALPDLTVNSLVFDKNDELWIGTDKGIGVIYCPQNIFEQGGCDAQRIIVTGADGIPGYLLEAERVKSIAVDGGNRKWVGTENGVWLLSEDGTKELARFTVDNSPLFSNIIIDIAVDDKTGIVYIGTDKGLLAYQSDATEAVFADKCELAVSPNPVNHGYDGQITVRDLPYNCTVKVMDASGEMVYQGRSNGGTFSWDCKTYLGQKAASGVYYVTAASNDGTYTCNGKFIIIK